MWLTNGETVLWSSIQNDVGEFVKSRSNGPFLKEEENHFVYQEKKDKRKNACSLPEIRPFVSQRKKKPSGLLWNDDHLELLYLSG